MIFEVPQFLNIETKLIGPIGFRELVYIIGSIALLFGSIQLFGVSWGIIASAPLIALGMALAFYRPNNKPFVYMVEAAIKFLFSQKKYRWGRNQKDNRQVQLLEEVSLAKKNLKDLSKVSAKLDVTDVNE